jgi:hypothetical protein
VRATLQQRYELVEPEFVDIGGRRYYVQFEPDPNYRYENNGRTIIIRDGDIEERTGLRAGIKAGLQYELTLGRWRVMPGMFYNFAITKVTSRENWRANALQLGVDFRTAF